MTIHSTAHVINPPRTSQGSGPSQPELHPADDLMTYMQEYARQRPEVAALWCFGIGFILGWKLKPW